MQKIKPLALTACVLRVSITRSSLLFTFSENCGNINDKLIFVYSKFTHFSEWICYSFSFIFFISEIRSVNFNISQLR